MREDKKFEDDNVTNESTLIPIKVKDRAGLETQSRVDYQREVRGLFAPLLTILFVTALLVAVLAISQSWMTQHNGRSGSSFGEVPAVMFPLLRALPSLNIALPAVIITLLAVGTYRVGTGQGGSPESSLSRPQRSRSTLIPSGAATLSSRRL